MADKTLVEMLEEARECLVAHVDHYDVGQSFQSALRRITEALAVAREQEKELTRLRKKCADLREDIDDLTGAT